ncbi:hypothetical protein IV203_010796 [Nitzschia inconspicua]|uniref:Uncharacterized protein n=1 Tax=Nitzschia inconspicua TaxID=303405 RepID=A0A9K3KYI5_9STRA|nr:hypothetical protein IV203_010796 [Nitzschia inconspicua]
MRQQNQQRQRQQKSTAAAKTTTAQHTDNQNPFQKMFSSFSLTLYALNALLVEGIQLRGTFDSRNLEVEDTSTCIPVGDAPFNKVAFVAVDLNGTDALNATTFDLFNLATAFELAYENQVDCSAVPGSRREVGRTNTLIEAVGPDGASTQLLRVELFCNACGDDDEIELFRDSSSTRKADDEDMSVVQCACDGPFIPTFLGLYNEIFAATTFASISIIDVDQLPILDCGEQNFTTYNASGVCLGLDALAFQDDQIDFPSSAPSAYPSEYPSEYPSQFPSEFPTEYPTDTPTDKPSISPSRPPTERPTSMSPTSSPTIVTRSPTASSIVETPSPTASPRTPSPTSVDDETEEEAPPEDGEEETEEETDDEEETDENDLDENNLDKEYTNEEQETTNEDKEFDYNKDDDNEEEKVKEEKPENEKIDEKEEDSEKSEEPKDENEEPPMVDVETDEEP